jgi:hypothetical protein
LKEKNEIGKGKGTCRMITWGRIVMRKMVKVE